MLVEGYVEVSLTVSAEILTYFAYVSEVHRPNAFISWADLPLAAAWVVAPIHDLNPLYLFLC